MSIFILGSYAKALVMTAERIPLAGETLIGTDFRQTRVERGRIWPYRRPDSEPTWPMQVWSATIRLAMNSSR